MVAENLEDTLMGPEPKEEEDSNVFYDVAMAPFRGAEGALYSAYQLADDYLLNDVLPDWESRALGTSKTIPGMAVEGVAQFVTGWFPFLRATKGLALAGKGAKALRGIGTAAAADFTAFVGQENRLSNLIQQVPELQNPVTEFLAHDADEGEIEGRLKNVLEGLGLEALGFAFIRGLKAVKDGKAKFDETGSEDAVRSVVSETLGGGTALASIKAPRYIDEFRESIIDEWDYRLQEDALSDEVAEAIPDFPKPYRDFLKALEKEDWLGFDYPSQAVNEIITSPTVYDDFEISPALKATVTKLENAFFKGDIAEPGLSRRSGIFSARIDEKTKDFLLKGRKAEEEGRAIQTGGAPVEGVQKAATVRNTLDELSKNANTAEVQQLAKDLNSIIKDEADQDVRVFYKPEVSEGDITTVRGGADDIGSITGVYKPSQDRIELYAGADEQTLVHEILHGVTAKKINAWVSQGGDDRSLVLSNIDNVINNKAAPKPIRELAKSFKLASEKIKDLYAFEGKDVFDPAVGKGVYEFKDLDEFLVGAFTDLKLQQILRRIPSDDKRSIFQKIVDAVYQLFGVKGDSTLLNKVIRDSAQIISASRDTYIGKAKLVAEGRYYQTRPNLWSVPEQEITSAATSINVAKLPAAYNKLKKAGIFTKGMKMVDIGGGKFDNAVDMLKGEGVDLKVYDPFNRSAQHNKEVAKAVQGGQVDAAISNNVLNVIKEKENQLLVVEQAFDAVKGNGKAYFSVYEGSKSGVGKETKAGFQHNKKTADYVSLVEDVFGKGNVEVKNNIITATKQADEGLASVRRDVPDFKPAKQDEFLNQIPEHFREYVGAVLRGQSIDMPQFRTDNDGYVLKEILDKIAENDPDFVARYTKDWKDTDTFKTGDEVVDNAYAGQLLNLDPIEAAKIARQQQAVWRVEGKGLVEKVLKARDEVRDSGFGEIPAANLKNAFQELVEFADRYRRLGREAALLLGERREKFRGVGRKVGLDEAEVLTDGVRREYLNKNGNWTKKARQLVEILEYVDPEDLDGAIKTVTGIAKKSQGNSWLDMPLEYWMNSILSGSAQIVNAVGASFTGTMHTLETAIGGLFSRNPRIAKEALAGWADLSSMHEGFKLYIQALKNDRTFFNQANKFDLRDPAIIPERFGLRKQQSQQVADWDLEQGLEPMNQTSKAYKAIDLLGKAIRLPSRHLTAQDTFFKTMFARRELRLRLALDAMKDADAGVPREVIAERIQKQLSGLIDENGRAFSEETLIREGLAEADAKGLKGNERAKYAMQYKQTQSKSVDTYNKLKAVGMADHLTMMEELKPGIAKSLQNMTNAHPGLKLVLPFIRTPTNILNYAIGRTPFGKQFYKDFKTVWRDAKDNLEGGSLDEAYDDLSKALESQDPLVVARAKGRLAVSSITAGVLVDAYFNNRFNITGGGPSDEKQIAQLKQTGWRPYSIKIGDTYYSYVKLDPYATILGTVADMIEVGIKEEKGFDETGMQHLMSSLIITIQRNIFNKSYMTGLDTLVKVAQQPERYGDYALQSFGSSLVPYSSALGRLNEYQGDQISREINSLKEAVLYKIPGQREKLDPKRNILGEAMITENKPLFGVINPIAYSTEKSNAVLTEMANLKHAFRQPSSRREGGLVEMLNFTNAAGQSSYDRWLELTGTIKVGRRTLNQALEKLINSKQYNRLLPFSPETGLESPRVRAITNMLGKYRSRAFNQMLKESYVDEDGIALSDIYERVNRAKIIASRGASREDVLELLTQ